MTHPRNSCALTTDLYELTMALAYFRRGMTGPAVFELFVRELPADRGFLVSCGLETALEYLSELRFTGEDIDYLRNLSTFSRADDAFWNYLSEFRFTGDVKAVPEGVPVMPQEPFLQVRAPLIEAQIVESYLLATINHQTMVATKAARVVDAAQGRGVADFGLRRAHGVEAGFWAARASYVGGCTGTSNVEAARELGIRPVGTAAHAYTLAFGDEEEAFAHYVDTFPENAVLLIDTYDTIEGARRAAAFGKRLAGVRLDSGDLAALSKQVRRILDEAGCEAATIVASGDLNEFKIARLLESDAPIDMFGVGTELTTSRDAPALPGVYKLVAIEEEGKTVPRAKRSTGKAMLPGAKAVYRRRGGDGAYLGDLIGREGEPPPEHMEPLLEPVMVRGKINVELPSLDEIRERATIERRRLPEGVRRIESPDTYPVSLSAGLTELADEVELATNREGDIP